MNILRCLGGLLLLTAVFPAFAGRVFTHSYLASVADKGEFEYAQWVTLLDDVEADSRFQAFEFRHEFEMGMSDVWQLAFYVPDWAYVRDSSGGDNGADFTDVAVETIYQLRDPRNSSFGLAVYGEARLGDDVFALEPKLILDKRIGDWILAWNIVLEAEWSGDGYDEREGKFANTLGASYRISPHWRAGVEATWAVEYEDFSDREDAISYIGPNVYYKGHEWWLGATLLKQLSSEAEEPDTSLRLILGVEFE